VPVVWNIDQQPREIHAGQLLTDVILREDSPSKIVINA
jgi:hypothetical protein